MARRRRRAVTSAPDLPAEEHAALILSGARTPEVAELFALIHRINPTGESTSLTEHQRRTRYHHKSRLQSLLVARYRDALTVERVPGRPHLVSLRHRFSRTDACHALLDSLDTPARNWILSELAR
jgi:hypothetical protein